MSEQQTAAEIEAELEAAGGWQEQQEVVEDGESGATTEAAQIEAELAKAENKAIRQGWLPKDQYKGDPKKWVDAKTFVERGERFVVNLQQEVSALRRELQDFQGTKAAFVKFHEETIKKKDEELQAAISELRIQRSQAQSDGEHETVIQIEDRIDLLKEQQKELKIPVKQETPATTAAQVDMNNPVLIEWISDENQWFENEPKLRDYAIAVGERLLHDGETARGRLFLDKISEVMRRDFPRRFKTTASGTNNLGGAASGAGNSGSRSSGGTAGKTARDLPEEDRLLMKQFIKEGWTTEEKFLASYFSRN